MRTNRMGRVVPLLVVVMVTLLAVVVAGPVRPALAADRLPGVALVKPVDGGVMRAFDPPLSAYGPGHRGIDLGAAAGDPVRAGAAGVVTFAGQVAGRPVVTINHGSGIDTTYEPVRARVSTGDRVGAGELIGSLSTGGHSIGLHWGLRRGGAYFDPMLHLVVGLAEPAGPVRLLPLDTQPAPSAAAVAPSAAGASAGASDRPVSGPVTSRFGMRLHPVLKVWKLHDGVDFGAPCGVPVRSVGVGTVVLAQRHVAYGNWVVIDAGGGASLRLRPPGNGRGASGPAGQCRCPPGCGGLDGVLDRVSPALHGLAGRSGHQPGVSGRRARFRRGGGPG